MLNLETGVGLEEVELVARAFGGVQQKLERPQRGVADIPGDPYRRLDDRVACRAPQVRRRRDFDDLLKSALDRAFAFPQVSDAAVEIANDLHFDVSRTWDQLLHVERAGAEGHLRLGDASFPGRLEIANLVDRPRTSSAAPGDRFEHDRRFSAQALEEAERFVQADRLVRPLDHRHACLAGGLPRANLVAE